MSTKVLIMAGLAVAFGATSYFAGNRWLESQAEARLSQIESRPAVEVSNVVVAATSLRFGEKLTAEKLKLVQWPKDGRPEGSFATIEEVIADGERKVIKAIEPGEPVLTVKLTGENGRAGLAGIIADGMRAVTIPVDMVNGVGGFVQPGDRVDIVLTRRDREEGDQTAKIIMEYVKVLSIDQQADTRSDAPKVAQTVTLETDAEGAQKLALSTSLGRLSLLLRSAGDDETVRADELSGSDFDGKKPEQASAAGSSLSSFFRQEKKFATVRVVRGEKEFTHTVPIMKDSENDANKNN